MECVYACYLCNKEYNQLGKLRSHMDNHHPNSINTNNGALLHAADLPSLLPKVTTKNATQKCTLCDRVLDSMAELIKHLKSHNQIPPHRCSLCSKGFTSTYNLHQHLTLHSKLARPNQIKTHQCLHCGRIFPSAYYLERHLIIHSKDNSRTEYESHTCSRCGDCFTSSSDLSQHLHVHSESSSDSQQLCRGACEKRFPGPESSVQSMSNSMYICSLCHQEFVHFPSLGKHLCMGVQVPMYNAVEPAMMVSEQTESKMNSNLEQNQQILEYSVNDWSVQILTESIRNSDKKRPVKCLKYEKKSYGLPKFEKCSTVHRLDTKSAYQGQFLNLSEDMHHLQANYKNKNKPAYSACGQQKFRGLPYLKKHSKTCRAKGKYTWCGKDFIYGDHLNMHIGNHYKADAYQCPKCNETFHDQTSLITHLEVHIKLHNCSQCGTDFTTTEAFEAHMLKHAYGCKYTSPFCTKKPKLKLHEVVTSNNVFSSCSKCVRGFFNVTELETHLFAHNNEILPKEQGYF